jgi:hypothetical protein
MTVSAVVKDFPSSLCVQTSSEAHPTCCTMGTGGSFPGGKSRPGRDSDHSPPSSAEVKNKSELYPLYPLAPAWRTGTALFYFYYICVSSWQGGINLIIQLVVDLRPTSVLTDRS